VGVISRQLLDDLMVTIVSNLLGILDYWVLNDLD
jgi:hypothetical protein